MFTPYSKLSAEEQAAQKLVALAATIPAKQSTVRRVLYNAVAYLRKRDIHPDNYGAVARLWKRL